MMYESTVSQDGHLTVPPDVLMLLGVGLGDTVCWYQQWPELRRLTVLRKRPNPSREKMTAALALLVEYQAEVGSDKSCAADFLSESREKRGNPR